MKFQVLTPDSDSTAQRKMVNTYEWLDGEMKGCATIIEHSVDKRWIDVRDSQTDDILDIDRCHIAFRTRDDR
jgi:hypothetical protein